MEQDRLILPPRAVARCLFGALLRDTRGRGLSGAELFNHFPASSLVSVNWVFSGVLHPVAGEIGPALPRLMLAGPQSMPVTSWSPGAVLAVSLGIWPEAWRALSGQDPGARRRSGAGAAACHV